MPSELETPTIQVFGFVQTLEMLPVVGNPEKDEVDSLGYKLDAKGAVIKAVQPEDWVFYSPSGQEQKSRIKERVRWLKPDPRRVGEDQGGMRLAFATQRWAQIEPAYEAWKKGQEIPLNGTALAAWPGITQSEADMLRKNGIRSVEQLRDLNEGQIQSIRVPHLREKMKQAKLFLDNSGAAAAAAREAEKDQRIEALEAKLAELASALKKEQPTDDDPVDEVAALRAELDERGIEYDRRLAAPKLRALLAKADKAATDSGDED